MLSATITFVCCKVPFNNSFYHSSSIPTIEKGGRILMAGSVRRPKPFCNFTEKEWKKSPRYSLPPWKSFSVIADLYQLLIVVSTSWLPRFLLLFFSYLPCCKNVFHHTFMTWDGIRIRNSLSKDENNGKCSVHLHFCLLTMRNIIQTRYPLTGLIVIVICYLFNINPWIVNGASVDHILSEKQ